MSSGWRAARRFLTGAVEIDIEAERRALRERSGPPEDENVKFAAQHLDTLLGRLLAARNQLDAKAALIIPAIGAIGGVAIGRVSTPATWQGLLLGGLALVLAVAAVVYAVAALLPVDHQAGPNAPNTARETHIKKHHFYAQAVLDEVALAIVHTAAIVEVKGTRVGWALRLAGTAVILMLLFLAAEITAPTEVPQ